MKQIFKRIVSFSLSICIIAVSIFLCPVSVYANSSGVHPNPSYTPGHILINGVEEACWYLISQMGALVDGSFFKYMENKATWNDYWNGDNVTEVTDDDGNVISYTFSEDLVAYIKQALIEYNQETNGFYLLPTTDYRTVPAEQFRSAPQYRTFKNIVEEKGIIVVQIPTISTYSFRFVDPFSDPDDPVSLVGSYDMISSLEQYPWIPIRANFYGTNDWKSKKYRWQVFPDLETVYRGSSGAVDYNTGNVNYDFATSCLVNYDMSHHGSYYPDSSIIYSTSGEKVRVFVSITAMKNYSVDNRTVYFSKDFFDFVPSDITATWDEINDRIEHIDDILQQLLDKITDSDDEDTIAELLQEILDAIKNGGGGGNGDNQGGGNTGSSGGAPSAWYAAVLDYLADISMTLKGLVWIETDNKLDKDKSDLFDLIDKIWKNPETGSQEAADTLSGSFAEIASGITKKFPFSIPWDIYALFTVFSGTPPPDTVTYHTVTLGVQPFTVDDEDLEQDEHEAPYFKLPLRIDSFRIYEEVVIDLKDFKPVSKLSRGLLAVLFAVFLIKFTIRIIELFRGGTDD